MLLGESAGSDCGFGLWLCLPCSLQAFEEDKKKAILRLETLHPTLIRYNPKAKSRSGWRKHEFLKQDANGGSPQTLLLYFDSVRCASVLVAKLCILHLI